MAKKTDKTDAIKKNMLIAMEKALGVVTTACRECKISRDTHYRWLKEDEKYMEAIQDISNVALDFAESKLHENISKGKEVSTIFFLKTKGKKRGYVERQEHYVAAGKNAEFPDWMTDE